MTLSTIHIVPIITAVTLIAIGILHNVITVAPCKIQSEENATIRMKEKCFASVLQWH